MLYPPIFAANMAKEEADYGQDCIDAAGVLVPLNTVMTVDAMEEEPASAPVEQLAAEDVHSKDEVDDGDNVELEVVDAADIVEELNPEHGLNSVKGL